MAESVRGKIKKGVFWNGLQNILLKGVGFVIGIILARLLNPSDYGLIGMLSIFLALSSTLTDAGMSNALVQRHDCTDLDYSTVFVTNMVMSVLMYVALFFSAPWIANFYHQPILCSLTRVVGLGIILSAVNTVHRAQLNIAVDFKSQAKINVESSIISGIIGITLAYCGFGVWSLVIQGLANTVVAMFLFPLFTKWKPSIRFSRESFSHLWSYGSKLVVAGVGSTILNNIQNIAIGKVYSSAELGFYTKGQSTPQMLSDTLYSVLGNVSFPVMSEIKDDKGHLVKVYQKSLFITAMIVLPMMILLALLSRPLVIIMFTEKWLPCVVFMQWFCLARMFTPLSSLNISILNASGHSGTFMWMDFSKYPLIILILAITIPLGPKAMSIGVFIDTFICFFINAYFPGKYFGYGAIRQIKDWRYIILSVAIMSVVVIGLIHIIGNVWLQVIVCGILGLGVYFACCLLFKIIDRKKVFEIINSSISHKFKK